MSIRKYLFWITDSGIKTYKFLENGKFDMLKPNGSEIFPDTNLSVFLKWFHKSAAITSDENIDFCFLSDSLMESPELQYHTIAKSSWDKLEISMFCDQCIGLDNYKIYYTNTEYFVCQKSNIIDKTSIKEVYLKCVPEFSIDTKENVDMGNEETSLVNRYYMEWLKELDNN